MDITKAIETFEAMGKPVTREDVEKYLANIETRRLEDLEQVEFNYSCQRDSPMGKSIGEM